MSADYYQQVVLDYSEGRRTVQHVVRAVQSYNGPEPHLLWVDVPLPRDYGEDIDVDHEDGAEEVECLFQYCLHSMSEERLFCLLSALMEAEPGLPAVTRNGECFLHVAQWHVPAVSSRVTLPLCVPQVVRATGLPGDTLLMAAVE
jgi:hypothetical protein